MLGMRFGLFRQGWRQNAGIEDLALTETWAQGATRLNGNPWPGFFGPPDPFDAAERTNTALFGSGPFGRGTFTTQWMAPDSLVLSVRPGTPIAAGRFDDVNLASLTLRGIRDVWLKVAESLTPDTFSLHVEGVQRAFIVGHQTKANRITILEDGSAVVGARTQPKNLFDIRTGQGNDQVEIKRQPLRDGQWEKDGADTEIKVALGEGDNRLEASEIDGSLSITAGDDDDEIKAGGGNDKAQLGGGTNLFVGGAGKDTLIVNGLKDLFVGFEGFIGVEDAPQPGSQRYQLLLNDIGLKYKDVLYEAVLIDTLGQDGKTYLEGVEEIRFADGVFSIKPGKSKPPKPPKPPKEKGKPPPAENKPPVAANAELVLDEDTEATFDLRDFAQDPDPQDVLWIVVNALQKAAQVQLSAGPLPLALNVPFDGQITVRPDADWHGVAARGTWYAQDRFDATNPDVEFSNLAGLRIVVRPVNDAPRLKKAGDVIEVRTGKNQDATVALDDILGRFFEVDRQPGNRPGDRESNIITGVSEVGPAANGAAFLLAAQQVVRYSPNLDFVGEDKFQVFVSDLMGAKSEGLTIRVIVTDDAPIANPDMFDVAGTGSGSFFIIEVFVAQILANDFDPNNDAIFLDFIRPIPGVQVLLPDDLRAPGAAVTFIIDPVFTVRKYVDLRYGIVDEAGNTGESVITFRLPELSFAQDDHYEVAAGESRLEVAPRGVLKNDVPTPGLRDVFTGAELVGEANRDVLAGFVFDTETGAFTAEFDPAFKGEAVIFEYSPVRAVHGEVWVDRPAKVTVKVPNKAPEFATDIPLVFTARDTLADDTGRELGALAGLVSDRNGDPLTLAITGFGAGTPAGAFALVDGKVVQTRDLGPGRYTFTVRADDGDGGIASAEVTVEITPRDKPEPGDDYLTMGPRQLRLEVPFSSILGNDDPKDGGPLAIVDVRLGDSAALRDHLRDGGTVDDFPLQFEVDWIVESLIIRWQWDEALGPSPRLGAGPGPLGPYQLSLEYSVLNGNGTADGLIYVYRMSEDDEPIGPKPGTPDRYVMDPGQTTLTVAAPGVLANDLGPTRAFLLVGLGDLNAQSFTFNQNGSFTYTPHAWFKGVANFFYAPEGGLETEVQIVVPNKPPRFFGTPFRFEEPDTPSDDAGRVLGTIGAEDPNLESVGLRILRVNAGTPADAFRMEDGTVVQAMDLPPGTYGFDVEAFDEDGATVTAPVWVVITDYPV